MLIIKCFKSNTISKCNYNIYIIDQKNNIRMYKSCNGTILLEVNKGIYNIYLFNMVKTVYYNKDDLMVTFVFPCNYSKNKIFILTDANYDGLKIGKGKLRLNGI